VTRGHDFFAAPELPRPDVSLELARLVARQEYGVEGRVHELGSQQERTFAVHTASGRYVLKVANSAFSDDEVSAQDAALAHVAARADHVAVPRSVPTLGGPLVARFDGPAGTLRARLLTFVPGFPLAEQDFLAPVVVERLGRLAGSVTAVLTSLDVPGLDRVLQWDVRNARRVCELLAPYLTDPVRREALLTAVAGACDRLDRLGPELRVQPVHGDVTDDNVVCVRDPDGRPDPTGVIDFGDIGLGWVVGDLAATCASVLHHEPDRPLAAVAAVRGYAEQVPLTEPEAAAVWPAVVARAAVLVVSGVHQGLIDPGNDYAVSAQEREWQMFVSAAAMPADVATAAFQDALGLRRPVTTPGFTVTSPLVPALTSVAVAVVDLAVTSDLLHSGNWLDPAIEDDLMASQPATIARYGEARLTRTSVDSREAPATVALTVEVGCAPGAAVHAPFAGRVEQVQDGCVLVGANLDLWLTGVLPHAEGDIAAGALLGTAADRTGRARLTAQLCTVRGLRPPAFVRPEEASAWQAVCPEPSALLGLSGDLRITAATAREVLELRSAALAEVQEHYYHAPPRIERGWRHHLVDTGARTYLDAVNNVAGIGHAHPRVTAAATRQWNLLNTNSRFNYTAIAEFSARLAALLPDPLDTVFLVNSGSEAVDLALRLAKTFTGRPDVFCVAEGYHGWTMAADAVSTSVADNPQALTTRPSWVHPLAAPNPFRGQHRGADAGRHYIADATEAIAAGPVPAAFLCEAFYGNAGGIPLPDGYLTAVYAAVRDRGGLCIADEVQVGYGRLGSSFWGFEQQGVVPDVVTVAKAMGNGHPLGAVITRRDIAAAFSREGPFFSSAGGSPVSCAVGMAVLDVLQGERLQHNAARLGAHLRRRFEHLADEIPMIGAVHGLGLYMGVELVRDRETFEPATRETAAICERLLQLGVVLQPTGDRLNVLKIKPPLCLTPESADFFVERVAEVLTRGW
jgi:4-aminobutyrate aminotransferase-like enzyme/Ser/Thr protein kinase RdoA (MazF antagonist)